MKRTPLARRTPLRSGGPVRTSTRTRARNASNAELTRLCRRLVVELRDKNTCQRCGSGGVKQPVQWAHVKNRGAKSLTFVPWASLALCAGCHMWFDGNKGNLMHPGAGIIWWREKFPTRAAALDSWEKNRRRQRVNREMERLYLESEIGFYLSLNTFRESSRDDSSGQT